MSQEKLDLFKQKEENIHFDGVWDVSAEELKSYLGQVRLIDVRQPEEYTGELGHIKNAELIPLGDLERACDKIPKHEATVFICRSGNRSAQACFFLQQRGYHHIFNLKGGMILWNELNYDVVK